MNDAYNSYKNDITFLVVTVVPLDTEEKIVGLYQKNSGVVPDFPLVTFHGGGRTLAELYGMAGGGQVHIIHPDREVTPGIGTYPYKQPNLNEAIQKALDDDCNQGQETVCTLSVLNGIGDGEYRVGDIVTVQADKAPEGKEFDFWSGDIEFVNDIYSSVTTLKMPDWNISIAANYREVNETHVSHRQRVDNFKEIKISSITAKSFSFSAVPKGTYTFSLFTINGRCIVRKSVKMDGECTISFGGNDLPNSAYIVEIRGEKTALVRKVVISK